MSSAESCAHHLPLLSPFLSHSFAEQVLKDLGVDGTLMPVAVVTSRDAEAVTDPSLLAAMGATGPVSQPVRRYKWGDCYPLNRQHSDLILLKRMLLGDRVESLYTMLDDSYDRYVQFCEKYEENGKQLQLVVHDYCNLSCPHMEYEDYAKTKQGLESAKRAMAALSDENKVLAERLAQSEKERKVLADRVRANN
jgi:septin family protein